MTHNVRSRLVLCMRVTSRMRTASRRVAITNSAGRETWGTTVEPLSVQGAPPSSTCGWPSVVIILQSFPVLRKFTIFIALCVRHLGCLVALHTTITIIPQLYPLWASWAVRNYGCGRQPFTLTNGPRKWANERQNDLASLAYYGTVTLNKSSVKRRGGATVSTCLPKLQFRSIRRPSRITTILVVVGL